MVCFLLGKPKAGSGLYKKIETYLLALMFVKLTN